jgi:hypothetical protein
MKVLVLPGWKIEYNREATASAYAIMPQNGPESCGCGPCRNWAATREQLFSNEFRELLDQFGVRFDCEREVYHNCKLESGLHSYGGWYHLVGRVLYGERECSQRVAFGAFSVFFHSSPVELPEAFADQPVVQLDFDVEVPWLSEVPEDTAG